MVSVQKRVIAAALSVLLATSPLMGCAKSAQDTGADSKAQEDLVKDGEQEEQGKTVPFSKQGEYTVTLQQADFTREEDEGEATEVQESDAEVQGTEQEGNAMEQTVAESAPKKSLAFDDVKLEDVKIYYDAVVNRAEIDAKESGDVEPQYESREAQVKVLGNDNGAITLSFVDPDAASNATDTYYVVIDALKSCALINVDIPQPILTAESSVASDSESSDVTIKAQDGMFVAGITAGDITLGGSFGGMSVTGAEAVGDTLIVHLSGAPQMDYEAASTYMDGQIIVAGTGFENTAKSATAYVPVSLPEEAFDLDGEEVLATATATGDVDYASVDGNTGKATVFLRADLGSFNDVKPENIVLEDGFAGGKVESVSKEGEDGDLLKVEVSFPTDGVSEDDYNLAGTLKLAAGVMTDENGNTAPEVESTVVVSSGEEMGKSEDEIKINDPLEDMGKKDSKSSEKLDERLLENDADSENDSNDGDANGKKAESAKKKDTTDETLAGAGVGLKYAGKWLKKVDPTMAKLANMSGEIFNIAGNAYAGKWSKVVESSIGLLKLCGISPEEEEVTAKDVLNEVKGLRSIVTALDAKVTNISKEDREDRYTQTSVRLKQMQDYIARANIMFKEAERILAKRKKSPMKAPGNNASNEEIVKYNAALRSVLLQEQKKAQQDEKSKSTMFVDVDYTMQELRKDLSTVTKWIAIKKGAINAGANPIDVFDKLVSMQFNWDTQGYYARLAFRGELTYTMQSAWAVVSTYYNATDPAVNGKYQPEADNVAEALEQVDARPAGTEPDEIRQLNQSGKDFKLYSPSLGYSVKRSRIVNGGLEASSKTDERLGNERINDYVSRLQGSLYDDLQLAGLEVGDENTKFDGIALRHHVSWVTIKPWFFSSELPVDNIEIWTQLLFQDKSVSSKKTFKGAKPATSKQVTGEKWYTFYWFDRID